MGRGRKGSGVEVRERSIRLSFTWHGKRYRETLALTPTPANIKYANRLADDVRRVVERGTFQFKDWFPGSPQVVAEQTTTLRAAGEAWMKTKGRLAPATRSQYQWALNFWYGQLGEQTNTHSITHSKIAEIVGSYPWASPKLCNNAMISLRGLFALLCKDGAAKDPTKGIANSKVQKSPPDPLSLDEVEVILADMREHYDPRVVAYFEFAFFSGLRPEEQIALHWEDIDWRMQQARIQRVRTFRGGIGPIKTHSVRGVDLNSRSLAALHSMRAYTQMCSEFVFENPVTGHPWHDERSQRDHYWRPSLRRLGIRGRRAYQTRHTFITLALMSGANPAYIARQAGHRTAKMVFEVYGKWIDGADRGREKDKIEAALHANLSPICPQEHSVPGRRDWTRTKK